MKILLVVIKHDLYLNIRTWLMSSQTKKKNSIIQFDFFRYAWTWSLILSDVSDDDAGEYTCRVSSSSDDQTLTIIKRFNLTVLSKHIYISHTSVTRFLIKKGASDCYLMRHKQYLLTPKNLFKTKKTFFHILTRQFLCNRRLPIAFLHLFFC